MYDEPGTVCAVSLEIDYPDRELNRLTSFFRPIVAIPIVLIFSLVSGPETHGPSDTASISAGGMLSIATALMIAFRQKYPRWWFDWNAALTAFGIRVMSYLALLGDEYPSTDSNQAVHLTILPPDVPTLNRWLPLAKWLLAVPHYVVLCVLTIAGIASVILAWCAILVTGHYPRTLFDFVVGVFRWWLRVAAYAFLLVTDEYPPFRLAA